MSRQPMDSKPIARCEKASKDMWRRALRVTGTVRQEGPSGQSGGASQGGAGTWITRRTSHAETGEGHFSNELEVMRRRNEVRERAKAIPGKASKVRARSSTFTHRAVRDP